MKKLTKTQVFLLFFGIKKWEYSGSSIAPKDGDIRISKWTGEKQKYINEGPVSGFANFEYWEKIES